MREGWRSCKRDAITGPRRTELGSCCGVMRTAYCWSGERSPWSRQLAAGREWMRVQPRDGGDVQVVIVVQEYTAVRARPFYSAQVNSPSRLGGSRRTRLHRFSLRFRRNYESWEQVPVAVTPTSSRRCCKLSITRLKATTPAPGRKPQSARCEQTRRVSSPRPSPQLTRSGGQPSPPPTANSARAHRDAPQPSQLSHIGPQTTNDPVVRDHGRSLRRLSLGRKATQFGHRALSSDVAACGVQ